MTLSVWAMSSPLRSTGTRLSVPVNARERERKPAEDESSRTGDTPSADSEKMEYEAAANVPVLLRPLPGGRVKAVTLARYAFAIGGPPDLGERLGPTMNLSEYIVLFVCVAIMGTGVPGLGDAALTADVPGLADAGGFNRHTFLCGQSGSGKTYSLGVILEQLLTETDLRIVVLDPNSDFVRLGEVRGGADAAMAERYQKAARGVAVYSADTPGKRRLRLHAVDIDPATQAAALRLDPIEDREEYAALVEFLTSKGPLTLEKLAESSPEDRPEDRRRLLLRLRNLDVDRYGVWAGAEAGSVLDAVHDQDVRCVIVDLGSLPTPEEQSLVAAAVLADLWRRRQERKPVLIVIDEAHNVCPAEPPNQLVAVATEHAIRIAAEGRKFGLYLLVSTQRPQKIAENVLSQADNLVLMRLNSLADAAFTQAVFSFVPPSLIDRAVTFHQGEALIAGKISPQPTLLRFGARITEEGGADVPATWAAPR